MLIEKSQANIILTVYCWKKYISEYTDAVVFKVSDGVTEVEPSYEKRSRTRKYWTLRWNLEPGNYIVIEYDRTNSGKDSLQILEISGTEIREHYWYNETWYRPLSFEDILFSLHEHI